MHNYATTPGLTGKALLARPDVDDPNFERSVVYILAHSPAGAMGIVLNRPTTVGPADLVHPLTDWLEIAATPRVLFGGGPVETDGIIGIAADANNQETGVSSIDLSEPVDYIHSGLVRMFRGYSGWSPGQLDFELYRDGWFVVDSSAADVFDQDPETLWRRIIARQTDELQSLALYPDHPELN
ncbi:MAG: hypothetical protein EXQ63_08100 [Ilumatobacteraceae bacterium]|nr:hypothetical protein [Ilumatobacteraceae bacterium]